jgi:hypothetical protein
MLENTWREIEYRLDILRATNGAQIDMYWTWWVFLSSKANQFSVSRILCVLYALEMWWINYGPSVLSYILSRYSGKWSLCHPNPPTPCSYCLLQVIKAYDVGVSFNNISCECECYTIICAYLFHIFI